MAACLNIQDDLLIAANLICLARLAVVHSGFPPLWAGVLLFLSAVNNLCIAQKTVFAGHLLEKDSLRVLACRRKVSEDFMLAPCITQLSGWGEE